MRMKRITTYHLLPFLLLLVLEVASFAQAPVANKANARIGGRIIVKGQPAPGVQVLLGSLGKETGYLLLVRPELLGDSCIVANHLVLAGLKLFNGLLQAGDIACHGLQRLREIGGR